MPLFYKYLELKVLQVFLLFAVHIQTFFPNLFLFYIGVSSLNTLSLITGLSIASYKELALSGQLFTNGCEESQLSACPLF